MKAKNTSGEIIDLPKDCDCLSHDGPHWIHFDALWKQSNEQVREKGNTTGFAVEEGARLRQMIWEMEKRGIDEVLDD